jgi:6-phospho-3-hexuloisomerase
VTHQDADPLFRDLARILKSVDPEERRALSRAINEARGVFAAGAGRSGLVVRAFAMRLAHMGVRVHVVGDATTPAAGHGDLLIVASGSGRTESMLGVAGRAVAAGAKCAVVTGAILAPLVKVAHQKVLLPPTMPASTQDASAMGGVAPDPHALIQPMRTLFEQALFLFFDLVVLDLMALRGASAADMERRHANLE